MAKHYSQAPHTVERPAPPKPTASDDVPVPTDPPSGKVKPHGQPRAHAPVVAPAPPPFGYIRPHPVAGLMGQPVSVPRTCWSYSSRKSDDWASIPNPLGPDADGKRVTPAMLAACGYVPKASYSRMGRSWAVTVYDRPGSAECLAVISTGVSDHLVLVAGLPSLLKFLGDLVAVLGEEKSGGA